MSKKRYCREQIEQLLSNKNVFSCTNKTLTFKKSFKLNAIKLHRHGLTMREIFNQAGIGIEIMNREEIKGCMKRWKKIIKAKGPEGLSNPKGWPKKNELRKKPLSAEDKIKRLEAEIAYLKEENDFLARIRVKRAE